MSAAEVNIPLLRKAVEWAEAEAVKPDGEFCAWRQGEWRTDMKCGTVYCIAGFVAQTVDQRYATANTVEDVHVSQFAAEALGLTLGGCGLDGCTCEVHLFDGANTIEDVRRIAESLAGERL